MDELISRQAAIDAIVARIDARYKWKGFPKGEIGGLIAARMAIEDLPTAQPPIDEWCTDCKEYDSEKHRCPRWNRVIRTALAESQPGWIPCSERLPENKTCVLTTIYIPGRQRHARSGWYEDGLFMNDNGDTWNATDPEVVAWMPLPEPYEP